MRTLDYLAGPLSGLYWPAVLTALAVALTGGLLSVFVVLRRLAFIAHGVSHAAFAGVGLALALGFGAGSLGTFGLVVAVALLAAAFVSELGTHRGRSDAAIGIVVAGAMAAGFLLHARAVGHAMARGQRVPSLESVLFGDVLTVGWFDVVWAWALTALVVGALWWHRRAVVFWAFDGRGAAAAGVRARRARLVLLLLTALAVVTAVKLAGVVLATAVFVLPGAAALLAAGRLRAVLTLSVLFALLGAGGGIVASFELDWQAGPTVVLAMLVPYAVCLGLHRARGGGGEAGA